MTLLAMCDKDGIVYGSRPGIERIANIDPEEAEEAWLALLSPDPHSSDKIRAPEHEGRRIAEVSGGFHLLNFEYYRNLRNDDERREQNRQAQARFKAKGKKSAEVSQDKPEVSKGKPEVSTGKPQVITGNHESAESAQAEAEPLEREVRARPTIEQAIAAAQNLMITKQEAEQWWNARESTDWLKKSGDGFIAVGRNWQADMKGYVNTVRNSAAEKKATQATTGTRRQREEHAMSPEVLKTGRF
jgi:hypothetical protein